MNATYLRGELYYADLSKGVGSEQEGYRPVLIIQNDVGNKYSPTVIVAAVTSKVGVKPKLPTHYFLEAGTIGLTAPSIVLLEQLRTLDKRRLELCAFARPAPTIFMAQVLIIYAGSMPTTARKIFAPIAASAGDLITRLCRSQRIMKRNEGACDMEHDHLQENAEYAVNNVKYQVSASFQTPDDKIPTEDFADKLKRLILSEDVMNRSGKK